MQGSLFDYLAEHPEVSDILFTGGDPMFMTTKLIAQYFEPFKDPEFLPHVKNLRIGTRALTFWPQRFTTDKDADELMTLLREVKEVGGRHVAIMSHLGHVRELQTDKVRRRRARCAAAGSSKSPPSLRHAINPAPCHLGPSCPHLCAAAAAAAAAAAGGGGCRCATRSTASSRRRE